MKILVESLFDDAFKSLEKAMETEEGEFGIKSVKDASKQRKDAILVDISSGYSCVVLAGDDKIVVEGDKIQAQMIQKILKRLLGPTTNIEVKTNDSKDSDDKQHESRSYKHRRFM